MNTPDNIYLIKTSDGVIWHDDPKPSGLEQPEDICAYARADRSATELANKMLEEMIKLDMSQSCAFVFSHDYYHARLDVIASIAALRQALPPGSIIISRPRSVNIESLTDLDLKQAGLCRLSELSEAKGETGRLQSELFKLREKLKLAKQVLREAPELNMSNYHHDDVGKLNTAVIEAYTILVSE